MFKEWICRILKCDEEQGITSPIILKEFDATEVYTLLKSEFPKAQILLSDGKYKTTTRQELEWFLTKDKTDSYKYIPEFYDCDDFSFSLMGQLSTPEWGSLSFGILWTKTKTGAHAVNCFIDKNREIWVIEPQTDAIFKKPKDWTPFLVMM